IVENIINIPTGQPGSYIFLLSRSGQVIGFPPQAAEDLGWREDMKPSDLNLLATGNVVWQDIAQAMVKGQTGDAEIELNGHQKLVFYAPVPNTGWSLAFVLPVDELLESVNRASEAIESRLVVLRRQVISASLAVALIASILALLQAQRITRPIHELKQGVRAITQGNLSFRIPERGNDEIADLARAFNQMSRAVRDRMEELSSLSQISQALVSTLEVQEILQTAIREFARIFQIEQSGLVLFDETMEWGEVVADYQEAPHGSVIGLRIPLRDNPSIEYILANRRPLAVSDAQGDPVLAPVHDVMRRRHVKSILLVPLIVKGKIIGTIGLDSLRTQRTFTPSEINLAQTIANQIAVAVENAHLYAEVLAEKSKFETAALHMGDGLVLLDPNDAIEFINPQAQEMLKLLDRPLVGESLLEICPVGELTELLATRTTTREFPLTGEIQCGDGRPRDLSVNLTPVYDNAGSLQRWVLVIHDVTRLKEVDRLKSEFVSSVSHELRTPLAAIMGFTEMILSFHPEELTPEVREFLEIIRQNSQRLERLINDLLDISRLE
ncbi:MAG TPA: GAF domain-containing protein, partial [Anaerolineae bacterium]|nr:GAF domain-containing protein [Anaerolineae bacterium]